ncbi:outer membrane lipoprotein carrier protein LolA [Thermosulfurimonas marina]|uniref:Outer membrane lipoprotein carrier protein LolA n=1 Tax=Thermosulfurimonas marina TaxID=2047767 RepID=A0A6H1WSX8_9BACT|nr:outer membrane lipoprotein carrier protein LolA [Thermosulfurimonas marina]QJA06292.1 outer membrane lipoprotein carrier protein LolA [Thermosulfurimonas marina]
MVRAMVCVLVLCWWVASLEAAPTPQEVLKKVEAFYRGITSVSGSFSQEVYWRKGLTVEASSGRFWFEKPRRLRWEYLSPERLLLVSDGKRVYFYVEADRQVTILSPDKAFSRPVLKLLSGTGDLAQEFEILSGVPEGPEDYLLELKPRHEEQISRLRIRVHLPQGEIREVWYWDPLGNLTHLSLENLCVNPKIKPKLFVFVPPPEVEILDQTQGGS